MKLKYRKRALRYNLITYGMVTFFYVLWEIMMNTGNMSSLMKGMLVSLCYYSMLAVSLNLVVGISGELSLGHAGFMSVGAFSGVLLWTVVGDSLPAFVAIPLAFIVGGIVAGIFGVIVGVPVLRLSGDYLAIVTLAFGEIIKNIINALYLGVDENGIHVSLTDANSMGLSADGDTLINGAMGITGIKKASTFTIGFVLILITLIVILNLINSRTGRAVMAIRDNEIAAQSVGINLTRFKLTAFVVSAVFAGFAGVLYGMNYSSLVASRFDYNTSIQILVFVVLGGIGSIRGSIIAAALLTVLPEVLRGLQDYRMLIYAIVLIVVMIFNQSPQIVAWRKRIINRLSPKKGESEKKGVA